MACITRESLRRKNFRRPNRNFYTPWHFHSSKKKSPNRRFLRYSRRIFISQGNLPSEMLFRLRPLRLAPAFCALERNSRAQYSSFHIRGIFIQTGFRPSSTWIKYSTLRCLCTPLTHLSCSANCGGRLPGFSHRSRRAKKKGWSGTRCWIPPIKTLNRFETSSSRQRKNFLISDYT